MTAGPKTTAAAETPPSRLLTSANPNFSDNGRRGRYGVAFLRSLAAHAGVGFMENSPDEDVDAVDAALQFARASVRVQVKCTGTFKVGPGRATLDLEPGWVEKWSESYEPVYVVLVKVPSVVSDWIEGQSASTVHKAVAFGKLFDPVAHTTSMQFTEADLLTTEMLYDWRDELYARHEGSREGAA